MGSLREGEIGMFTDPRIERPGLLAFSAIIMVLVAINHFMFGVSALADSKWLLPGVDTWLRERLAIWGLIDVALAVIALAAAYSLMRGGSYGYWVTVVMGVVSAARWLVYIAVIPVAAALFIVIAGLAVYGVMENVNYFFPKSRDRGPRDLAAD